MPEMPEVEGLRSFLDANLVGRTIASAHLAAFSGSSYLRWVGGRHAE